MLIICYDISENKLRTKFHKFLSKFGRPLQYSVFELKNSPRLLNTVLLEIETKFRPKFTLADSILIIPLSDAQQQKIIRYGHSVQEEQDLVWLG